MDPRTTIDNAGIEGARPYGASPGAVPAGGPFKAYTRDAVPFASDAPYVESYADRPSCEGNRTNGDACKAKTRPGMRTCQAHEDQE